MSPVRVAGRVARAWPFTSRTLRALESNTDSACLCGSQPRAVSRSLRKCPFNPLPPGMVRAGCWLPPRMVFSGPAGHPVIPQAGQVCWGEPAVRTIQGSDPVQSQSSCPSKHCELPTGHCCWPQWHRKRCLLSPGRLTARGCICCLPPPSLPPRHSQPSQQLGEAVRGEETGGTTPHIPCKAAPVLCWPCHLLPDWAQGLPGGLINRARRRAGPWLQGQANLEWKPCFDIYRMLHSLPTAMGRYVYVLLTNKEIKAQKRRVIVA